MYARGDTCIQDDTRVHIWLNLTAADGNERARKNVRRIEETTESETVRRAVAVGKRMAKEASEGEVMVRRDEKKDSGHVEE